MTPRPIPPGPARSPARRELMFMMGAVLIVHAVAIAIYRLGDLEHARRSTTQIFGAIWTAATLLVVGVGLVRVRKARGFRRGGSR